MGSSYDLKSSIPNKLLQPDGTVTDMLGNIPMDPVEVWDNKNALPNKFLNPDGTYSMLDEILPAPTPYNGNIKKIKSYLYQVEYDSLDYDFATKYFTDHQYNLPGLCTSIRTGDFYGRNYDWLYDENAEFIVKTARGNGTYASIGVASGIEGLTDTFVQSKTYNDLYKIIPFKIVDGINEYGVFANVNVVPTDKGMTTGTTPTGQMDIKLCDAMLIRFVLDKFKTATDAVTYLEEHVSIYTPSSLLLNNYDAHFMIGDTNNTYLLEFIENELVVVDMTEGTNSPLSGKPYMTNFHLSTVVLNLDGTVYTPETQDDNHNAKDTNLISDNGCGLERYNLIVNNYDNITDRYTMRTMLHSLLYTNSYKRGTSPFWYTEFVNIDGLTVVSKPSDFSEAVDKAITKYENRSRDPKSEYFGTWQTTHSSVYDIKNRALYLVSQEDGAEYAFTFDYYYTAKEIDEIISTISTPELFIVVDELPTVGEHNKIYLVPDGHGMFEEYYYNSNNQWDKLGTMSTDDFATKLDVANCLVSANQYTNTQIQEKILSVLGGEY